MTRAEKFIVIVFNAEGFYSDDKADKGGETLYGIARNIHPKWEGWKIVDLYKKAANFPENMRHDVKLLALKTTFYKSSFYDPVKADEINDELLALHVFDFGVNAGIGTAAKYLQKVAGVLADGVVGNDTLSKVNSSDITQKYIQERRNYYQKIADSSLTDYEKKIGRKANEKEKFSNTNYKFLKGWLNRVDNVTNALK